MTWWQDADYWRMVRRHSGLKQDGFEELDYLLTDPKPEEEEDSDGGD